MRAISLILSVAVLSLPGMTGCSPINRERLTEEIRKTDPDFIPVLDKHQELASRIDTYERELALKRSTVERNITQLRKELAASTASVNGKIAETKKKIEPDQERLRLALGMASEELRATRLQRASLGRAISQVKKASKSAGAAWTDAERARQDEKIQDMRADLSRVDQESAALREHVRLLKIKLLLIKL